MLEGIFWLDNRNFFLESHDTTINKNKKDEWRFIGFYGETYTQKRHELWAHLHSLKNRGNALWLYAGDSNEITRQSEKCGGRVGPYSQMHPFWDILDECGFMDMGFVGSQFTWHKHFVDYTVWERLVGLWQPMIGSIFSLIQRFITWT